MTSIVMEFWSVHIDDLYIGHLHLLFQIDTVVCDNQGHWDVDPKESKCAGEFSKEKTFLSNIWSCQKG